MDQEQAFKDQFKETPYDVSLQAVYADRLEENGRVKEAAKIREWIKKSEVRFSKEWYLANQGKEIKIGNRKCRVTQYRTESRQGSYERGLRFSDSKWGALVWHRKTAFPPTMYSLDHGKTWYRSYRGAMKSKNKVRLESSNHGEFAFDSIQRLNREYYGPGYKWHR